MKDVFITLALVLAAVVNLAGQVKPSRDWRDQGVIYLDHSLNARLHPVPVQAVHMADGFWSSRRRVTTERSLPTLLTELEEHGVVDNFRRLAGHNEISRKGRVSTDADLYKWIEAASWAVASNETSAGSKTELRGDIESLISHISSAQDASGYLDTYFVGDRAHLRFTDLAHSHEDFCLGHLLQAGIAYYRATGSRRLLDIGIRFANYLVTNFGPGKRPFFSGHPELEMALVELYRTTGDASYLEFTRYLFSGSERERLKLKDADMRYMFSGRPFTSHTELEGHAVRALYATAGATDYFVEAGDPAFKRTLDLLWSDLTLRKMYLTGGVGSRAAGESIGDAYELPSESAYAEVCSAVANVMWNFRLLMMTGDARYADVLERTLYNGANAGMSLAGNQYCYRTPLSSAAEKLRTAWNDTTCCPPNLERLFEALPGYVYATSRDGIYVNLFQSSTLDWHLQDGAELKVIQTTDYPWAGIIRLEVSPKKPTDFTMYVRWPSWATSMTASVNGLPVETRQNRSSSYLAVARKWTSGDVLTVEFPTPVRQTISNPRLADTYGRVALERGPLVYALEQIDQNNAPIGDIFLRPGTQITAEMKKDTLNGVILLKTQGQVTEKSLGEEPLYQPFAAAASRVRRPLPLTFVPYYAVGNREPSPMRVWIPMLRVEAAGAMPMLGRAFSKTPEAK